MAQSSAQPAQPGEGEVECLGHSTRAEAEAARLRDELDRECRQSCAADVGGKEALEALGDQLRHRRRVELVKGGQGVSLVHRGKSRGLRAIRGRNGLFPRSTIG